MTKAHKISSFENGLKEPTYINFPVTEKREWNKLPANQQTFDTYYKSMSVSYGRFQSLVHPRVSIVTQNSKIAQFSTRGYVRGGHGSGRGYGCIGYVHFCEHGRGG